MTAATKTKILDVAERLFAEHGVAGTSLRKIMADAGVNPASIHYHFGGKQPLVEAVVRRRLEPLNEQRLELLAAIEATADNAPPPLEPLLEAFVAPALRFSQEADGGGARFMRLMGRFWAEEGADSHALLREMFETVTQRFANAIRRALPAMDPTPFVWRLHFVIGAMAHTMKCREFVQWMEEDVDGDDHETAVRELVAFAAAGLRAAPVTTESAR